MPINKYFYLMIIYTNNKLAIFLVTTAPISKNMTGIKKGMFKNNNIYLFENCEFLNTL